MSHYRLNTLLWSGALIVFGLLLLLFNFDLFSDFEPVAQLVLAAILATGGCGFLLGYFASDGDWARLIPAWTLLALAAMVASSTIDAIGATAIAAMLFLGLAIAFANIYLLKRSERWWAIIPGGFMAVIGIVIWLSNSIAKAETLATILFVGMGSVFFLLYAIGDKRRHWWALVPGSVLVIFGLFILTLDSVQTGERGATLLRWWPLLLIGFGVLIGAANVRRLPREKLTVNSAPRARDNPQIDDADAPTDARPLGEYGRPAPGAAIELLPDPDEKPE